MTGVNIPGGPAGGEVAPFDVEICTEGPETVVRVVGEVDTATAPELRKSIEGLLNDGVTEIVVDLVGVPFMDSTGLGSLAHAHSRASGAGGGILLRSPQPNVVMALGFCGLDRVLKVC